MYLHEIILFSSFFLFSFEVWSAIMHDHPSAILVTTRKPFNTPPASSIIILTQTAEKLKPTSAAATNNKNKPNPLFDNDQHDHGDHKYAMDMDMDMDYGSSSVQQGSSTTTYLTGPLVFRVRPDGTPVDEDQQRPLPRDDDLEQYLETTGGVTANHSTSSKSSNNNNTNKHRKIATISSLKQQHFANLALHDQLQPPFALSVPSSSSSLSQIRRQFVNGNNGGAAEMNLASIFANYYYGRRQAL